MERTRFLGYQRTGARFVIKARRPSDGLIEFGCDYLVGADGAISGVRRALDPKGASQAQSCIACYSYYEFDGMGGLKNDWWYVFLKPEFGDIIACIHRKDDMLALSVGGFTGVKIKACEMNFVKHLKEEYGVQFGQKRCSTCCGIKIAPPCLGAGNLLLAGDAAGLIYLNGEGISAAMDSGYRAGLAIAKSFEGGVADTASLYQADCEDILRHRRRCLENMNFVVPRPQSCEPTPYALPVNTPAHAAGTAREVAGHGDSSFG
jgi:flavin-dependent dehydrogenase